MRKTFILAACALLFAKGASAFPLWGFQLGFNLNDYKYLIGDNRQDRSYLSGWNVGVMYRTDGRKWRVQPTLLWSQKGAQNVLDAPLQYSWISNRLTYLSLSAPVLYNANMEGIKNFTLSIGAGPYVGYLLKATAIKKLLHGGDDEREDYKMGSASTDDFKRGDFGLAFVFGAKLRRVNMAIGYDFGLANISPAENTSIKNRTISINFGVFVNKYQRK